jgi:hypothetical protein
MCTFSLRLCFYNLDKSNEHYFNYPYLSGNGGNKEFIELG